MRKSLSVVFYFLTLFSLELASSAVIYVFMTSGSPATDPILALAAAALLASYTNYRIARHLARKQE